MRGFFIFLNFICKHYNHVIFHENWAILDLKDYHRGRDFKHCFMVDGFALFVRVNYF